MKRIIPIFYATSQSAFVEFLANNKPGISIYPKFPRYFEGLQNRLHVAMSHPSNPSRYDRVSNYEQ